MAQPAVEQGAKANPISAWALNDRYSVAQKLLPDRFSSLADVGCGEGYFLGLVRSKYPESRLVGLDLHPHNIKFAKKRVRAGFVQGNAEAMPFRDSKFDVVVLLEILDHLENPGKALDEAFRVLKPGGVLILSIPDEPRLLWKLGWWAWTNTAGRRWHHAHVSGYDEKSLREMFQKHGFQAERVERALMGCIMTVRAKKCRKQPTAGSPKS